MARKEKEPEKLYTVSEVSEILRVCKKSIYRYIDAGLFGENLVIIQHEKRRRYIFPQSSLNAFIKAHTGGVPPVEREKRAYNRRKVKGQRTVKKKEGKAA